MTGSERCVSPVTTTEDRPSGDTILLRAKRHPEGDWTVGDAATARFGHADTLREALLAYCEDLEALTRLTPPFGPPIDAEVEYARKVFR